MGRPATVVSEFIGVHEFMDNSFKNKKSGTPDREVQSAAVMERFKPRSYGLDERDLCAASGYCFGIGNEKAQRMSGFGVSGSGALQGVTRIDVLSAHAPGKLEALHTQLELAPKAKSAMKSLKVVSIY